MYSDNTQLSSLHLSYFLICRGDTLSNCAGHKDRFLNPLSIYFSFALVFLIFFLFPIPQTGSVHQAIINFRPAGSCSSLLPGGVGYSSVPFGHKYAFSLTPCLLQLGTPGGTVKRFPSPHMVPGPFDRLLLGVGWLEPCPVQQSLEVS